MAPLYKATGPGGAGITSAVAIALAALVDTLDQAGVLPMERYRDTLRELWDQMPEADAAGADGFVFERLIDYMNDRIAKKQSPRGPDHPTAA